ncbi:MAG TPA: Na/Pi cotransporter family protein [Chloroflexota bacterium]|nr:Na/Pi cotransporter family protein [Chloroflexota bacterium]
MTTDPNLAIIYLVGAVFLLLYGMRVSGEALQRVVGHRLRRLLYGLGRNPLAAFGIGAAVTALMQSSSATTIMLVGFARAGLLEMRQALGIILGADVGTTLTVQLLAFRVYDYALLLVAIGGGMFLSSRRQGTRDVGQAIIGLGLVFLGLKTIIDVTSPLGGAPIVRQLFMALETAPLLAFTFAALFAAVTTSSAATIGIALALAGEGVLSLQAAMPIVLGANLGTTAAAFVSSFGGIPEARRVATAHVLFKSLGAAIFLPLVVPFADLAALSAADPARQVANAHTIFNLAIAVLFLPFTSLFGRLLASLVPDAPAEEGFRPKYLDEYALESPALALGEATREVLRMADDVQEMVVAILPLFRDNDPSGLDEISRRESQVDYLEEAIKGFLTRLSAQELSEDHSRKEVELIYMINELEHIGDIVDKSTAQMARQKIASGLSFSPQGMAELESLHQRVVENLRSITAAIANHDVELARKVLSEKSTINRMERELRQTHIRRLHAGLRESIETSSIHMDILNDLARINSHTANLAYVVLGEL